MTVTCVLADIDVEGDVVVPEAGRHDVEVWPHLHSAELQAKLFPVAKAVPEFENVDAEARDEHARLHRRWAAIRLSVSRG